MARSIPDALVKQAWTASYDPALAVAADQVVTVQREDSDWPGWWWCVDDSGLGGWLPADLLIKAAPGQTKTRAPFDTRELTVNAGELVTRAHHEHGWFWCKNSAGATGWLPDQVFEEKA